MSDELLKQIMTNLYSGEDKQVAFLVQEALRTGMGPREILGQGLIAGMDDVGRDFKSGELFVPEVLLAARAMHAGMNVLRPLLVGSGIPSAGRCLIGTVQGDLHDIGKNLVKMMWEGAGFEVIDLGTNVPPARFVEAVEELRPQILGMSALLTTTMYSMKNTVEALVGSKVRGQVKVLVGGAPVTQDFAMEIGADGYSPDAASAVDMARELVGR